jgi:protein-S-isoprenylcysteine O-methyltransferase Ste14
MIKLTKTKFRIFFDKPNNIKWMLRVFYLICVLLVALDFIVHRHIYLDFEKIPTFYALYGFVACVVLVLLAKIMRLMLMRSETYYEPGNSDDNSESGNNGRLD